MKPTLDIVGHFGTTFSYATVGSQVALRLLRMGYLGTVTNLDPAWHPDHEVLRERQPVLLQQERGSHVFVISAPHHYFDMYTKMYGREHAAIFMSPNTDRLADEHAKTCSLFDLAVAPSEWCAEVARRSMGRVVEGHVETDVAVAGLGVSDLLEETRLKRMQSVTERLRQPLKALHFSTDQSWPGRKGTEELLCAWRMAHLAPGDRLVVHVPPALRQDVERSIREFEIEDSVTIHVGELRGGTEAQMASRFDAVDLVVAPSRCEGYGIMLASALVAGVPLLSTYTTGQRDFLRELPGWLGVPHGADAELIGEEGEAPIVEPEVLAAQLSVAVLPEVRSTLLSLLRVDAGWKRHAWSSASRAFAGLLLDWMQRENRP